MTKRVHPNASFKACTSSNITSFEGSSGSSGNNICSKDNGSVALTVWKKSLLMNCKGFTVFDCNGNIVFRVDNYVAANRGEIVLMDADGKPLLTIRRKRFSWGDNWLVYDGESSVNPRYLVQKQGNRLVNTKTMSLAHVLLLGTSNKAQRAKNNSDKSILYNIEGSFAQRNVGIYNNKRQCVAEIKKKEAPIGVNLGGDVFKLNILRTSDIDCALAMALVILLDQMFGSS